MTRYARGLIVGKFCPLHRGHQYLIERARSLCEQLVILSYTRPEFPGCEPARRERWLADLYPDAIRCVLDDVRLAVACRQRGLPAVSLPDNDAADAVQRRFVAWVLRHLMDTVVDAVFTSEDYGDGFASALSAEQRAHGGPAVAHVMVDPQRVAVPVSGTVIRDDVHAARHYLSPAVYRDFVRRVAIIGGESTGKSTLAAQLAAAKGTVHAAEYGRELWEAKHGALVHDDMLHIARTQIVREETLVAQANRYLICDTTPLTTALYAEVMFDAVADELDALSRRAYDLVFLCSPDVPFVQDGTRRDEAFRQWQHEWYVRELKARNVAYRLLTGSWEARLSVARALL
ncbi:NadR type nicotinamide-nucleotide adenylyltransferase [Luteibacter sp. 1214]|uniref:AAA family ATPase n=1 Tax=Luteibacter sp. 1214 TaxID=2817735 RepID=UPI00285AC305|nr:AAA family ATPase [Luteibacter sp. 1214]MDR6641138.1 NadR type nicotinamide-nucleotide adenylyltransferase [Luteibacter sp. 1214]